MKKYYFFVQDKSPPLYIVYILSGILSFR